MSQRDTLLLALQALVATDDFFPPPALDEPQPSNWRTVPGAPTGTQDHCTVLEGPVTVTRDGGSENSWELQLEATVAYAVMSTDQPTRRAQRDAAADHLTALIAGARDLGTGDPQVYAEIDEGPERYDILIAKATAPAAAIDVKISIQFIADSAAG